jgi:hypothetical protein
MPSSSLLAQARQHIVIATSLFARLSTWERRSHPPLKNPQAFRYSHAHQACHRDHRRKSNLRSRVRHLSAEASRSGLEPAVKRHRQF